MPDVGVFEKYHDLLNSSVDSVIIATPHYFHPTIAIEAFQKGINVLTEKPIGFFRKVVRMIDAAKKSGKVFGIMYNQRTSPIFSAAREFVQRGP
jgi:predicted dehydrogenase